MLKRAFDLLASAIGLILLSPVFLIIAAAIKLDSAGPVFYLATRVGREGQLFRLHKFRTMVAGAHRQGPGITVAGDTRITAVGAFLRRTKLDELPQLINVVKGEMSLVGPRPEDPRYVEQYTTEQRRVLAVRPGITSPASLAYRHEEQLLDVDDWERRYVEQIMPNKLAVDLAYIDAEPTLFTDVKLIMRTVLAMFRHKAPGHE